MRTDHRRPLAAYVLVSVACAFVVAPSLDIGGLGLGQKPTFSAFSDTTMTPSEAADSIIDPTNFAPAPDAELVEPPVTDVGGAFAPGLAAIEDVLGPLFEPDGSAAVDSPAHTGSEPQGSDDGGAQLVSGPRSGLVDGDGPVEDGDTSTGGDDGGPAGPPAPDKTDGSRGFDGSPSGDGDPGTSPADGGGSDGAPGPENGNAHGHDAPGDSQGTAAPAPHSVDHVPPGNHPYGHVGAPPGTGPEDHEPGGPQDHEPGGPQGHEPGGPEDQDPQDRSQGKAPQDKSQGQSEGKGPQGRAHGHGKTHAKSRGHH